MNQTIPNFILHPSSFILLQFGEKDSNLRCLGQSQVAYR